MFAEIKNDALSYSNLDIVPVDLTRQTFGAEGGPDDEPTNGIETALTLEAGSFLDLELETALDVDFVRIELLADVDYLLNIQAIQTDRGTAPDITASIFDGNGELLFEANDDDNPQSGFAVIFTPSFDIDLFVATSADTDAEGETLQPGTYRFSLLAGDDIPREEIFDPLDVLPQDLFAFSNIEDPFGDILRWTPGQTFGFEIDPEFSASDQELIRNFFNEIGTVINLDFVEEENALFNVVINPSLSEGTLGEAFIISPLGNTISLAETDLPNKVFVHEALHGLGIFHANEQEDFFMPELHGIPFTLQGSTSIRLASGFEQSYGAFTSEVDITAPLVLDLEFLVALYGEDEANLGDNLYIFDTSKKYLEGLHDGGGTDSIMIIDDARLGVDIDLLRSAGLPRAGFDLGSTDSNGEGIRTVFLTESTVIENVNTGFGDDVVSGNNAANELDGSVGNDTLSGAAGDDLLVGGRGLDHLFGQAGNDTLVGGNNQDILIGGSGADVLLGGGSGLDRVVYSASSEGVSVTLAEAGEQEIGRAGDAEGDRISDIEQINGSGFNDTLIGNSVFNRLAGLAGNDSLDGAGGNDILTGGFGNDTITGGAGADIINGQPGFDFVDYRSNTSSVSLNLDLQSASGGEANGDTLIRIEGVFGSDFDDNITGSRFNNDLQGNEGDDTLSGGLGNDTLSGGSGADLFVIEAGNEVITDFSLNQNDSLDLSAFAFTGFSEVVSGALETDNSLIITLGDEGSVELLGLSLDDLAPGFLIL